MNGLLLMVYRPLMDVQRSALSLAIRASLSFALCSLSLAHAQTQGQTQAPTQEANAATAQAAGRIVTTPARAAQQLDVAIPNTVVITREAIAQAGSISLSELLRRHARLESVALGPYASAQGVAARGGSGGRVLFLLDGVPLGDAGATAAVARGLTGVPDIAQAAIEQIPLAMLERIEVSVGAMSAVYGGEGADAVIALFTRAEQAIKPRQKKPSSLQVDGQFGSESLRSIAAHVYTSSLDTQMSLTAGASRIDMGNVTSPLAPSYNTDRDPQQNAFVALKVSQQLFQGEHIAVSLVGIKGRQKTDIRGALSTFGNTVGGPPPIDISSDEQVERTLQIAKITSQSHFADYWRSRIELSRQFDKADYSGRIAERVRTTRDVTTWTNEIGIVGGKLIAGVEVKRDNVDTGGQNVNQLLRDRQTQSGAFIGLREKLGNHMLEANARVEKLSGTGDYNLSRTDKDRRPVSVSYAYASPWAELYAHGGRGYREPTMFERFAPLTQTNVSASRFGSEFAGLGNLRVATLGSPGLDVERTLTREIGIRKAGAIERKDAKADSYRLNIAGFSNEAKDGIVPSASLGTIADPSDPSKSIAAVILKPTNATLTTAKGVEISGDVEWNGYRLATQMVSQRVEAKIGDRSVPTGRARQYGYFSASKNLADVVDGAFFSKLTANASLTWSGGRTNPTTPILTPLGTFAAEEKLGGYTLVNVGFSYAVDREWTIDFIANNITDKRYELVRGFNQPGASVALNLRYSAVEK
jgi:vitamin B12 transporter